MTIGTLYYKKSRRRGAVILRIGENARYTMEYCVGNDMRNIEIGNYVILRVSDKYPRVFEVLEWKVTKEAIEKYFPSGSIR